MASPSACAWLVLAGYLAVAQVPEAETFQDRCRQALAGDDSKALVSTLTARGHTWAVLGVVKPAEKVLREAVGELMLGHGMTARFRGVAPGI